MQTHIKINSKNLRVGCFGCDVNHVFEVGYLFDVAHPLLTKPDIG